MRSLKKFQRHIDRNVPRKPGLVGGVKGPQYEMKLPYREAPACPGSLAQTSRRGIMMRLDQKVAMITGGSRGMGKQMALTFAGHGADIVIGDILEMDGLHKKSRL